MDSLSEHGPCLRPKDPTEAEEDKLQLRPGAVFINYWRVTFIMIAHCTLQVCRENSRHGLLVASLKFPGRDDEMTDSVVYVLMKTLWKLQSLFIASNRPGPLGALPADTDDV